MTGPLVNPTPSLRYTLAKGTIPDFSITTSISRSPPNITFEFTTGSQSQTVTADQSSLDPTDSASLGSIMYIVYADEKRIVVQIDGFLVVIFEDGEITQSVSIGSVSCSDGTVTIHAARGYNDITFQAPSWCYYLDPDGDHGLYPLGVLSTGLYGSDDPMCPFCYDIVSTGTLLYNDYQFAPSGGGDAFPYIENTPSITTSDGKVTAIDWTVDGTTYSAMISIFPITIEPTPETPTMLEIPVVYDPQTRRISLPKGYDTYGGATTDVNSVKLSFTGIESEGTNFIARVDFAVPIKMDNHNVIHPFVLLEQDNDEWSAVIPQSILGATVNNRNKLPLQLVIANDSQVINSRNTIVLDVTQGIDADTEGNTLPQYVVPEWDVTTDTVSDDTDVHVIEVTYDPETRMLTLDNENSKYGGATIDTRSVKIQVSGIVPNGADFGARLDFAVPIMVDEREVLKPFIVLENINNVWCAMVPQAILMAAHDIKKMPFQLVTRHGDTVINSRNTIVLEITRAINSAQSMIENYMPYLMYRNDTWEWISDFTYDKGAVVVYNGELYSSLIDNNRNITPPDHTDKWFLLTGIETVYLADEAGTRDGNAISFTSAQVFTAAGFTKTPVTVTELDAPVCSYEFPVESYTNEGYPLIEALHFGDLITGNDKFVMTNYDYGNDRRTANIYLYKYYGNEDRYDLLASMDANNIYHSGNSYLYIPLIVSSQMVVIWRLVNDIAPQGNSIRVYDFLNNTCDEYGLAYEGEVPPGEDHYGELNIVFNGTSSEEQIEINIIRQHDQAQYEFGMSYDSTSYCWCPIDNTFVGMHHSYGYESDYMPMYWKDKGFALLSDNDVAIYVDLNEGQIISTITDFEPVYVGQDPSYLYELITIDDPGVIKTIECIGVVTEGSITSVNATGWWHMDPDPEYWWDPDMPQGCVYKVANLTDPDIGSYDMYVGFEMYILPHRIEENTEGQ